MRVEPALLPQLDHADSYKLMPEQLRMTQAEEESKEKKKRNEDKLTSFPNFLGCIRLYEQLFDIYISFCLYQHTRIFT